MRVSTVSGVMRVGGILSPAWAVVVAVVQRENWMPREASSALGACCSSVSLFVHSDQFVVRNIKRRARSAMPPHCSVVGGIVRR